MELTVDNMLKMQIELQDKYKEKWGGLSPKKGRDMLLWLIGEVGEVADVIKQDGDEEIMDNEMIRGHFIEEMCDVMMYFNDILLCYDITPQEFERIYMKKHNTNMGRW
ncbi:MAG: MazG nucleotide pyrophosphohydrolase domain-containing protein [Oscillospiraceae bacterium]